MADGGKKPPDAVEELFQRLGTLRAAIVDEVDALEDLVARLPAKQQKGLPWRLPTNQPRPPSAGKAPVLPHSRTAGSSSIGSVSTIKAATMDVEGAVNGEKFDLVLTDRSQPKAKRDKQRFSTTSTQEPASVLASFPSSGSSFNMACRATRNLNGKSGEKGEEGRRSARVGLLGAPHQMSTRFEGFFAVAILLSGGLSGAEVQWKALNLGEEVPVGFTVIRNVFTLLFFVEFALRVHFVGPRKFFTSPGERTWAALDLVAVLGGFLEMCADAFVLFATSSPEASAEVLSNSFVFRNVRLLRIVRITRAFRLQRIIRFISALKTLVYSIAVTLKSLVWAMILLFIIVYVFGLAFTMEAIELMEEMIANGEEPPDMVSSSWGTLERSMFTLYQSISGGVSWGEPLKPLQGSSIIPTFLYTLYIAFTYFAVLNVVTGVFCSSALETTNRNPDLVARSLLDKRKESAKMLRSLFGAIDDDDSGVITTDELEIIANDDMVRAYFQALDIDFRDAFTLFKLIDTEKTGTVKLDDFLMGCEQLRGGATSVHIAEVAFEVKKLHKTLRTLLARIDVDQ